jgi:hypothetical protein
VPTGKSAAANCIVVRIDFERRAQLLEQHPETYYITEHYEPYRSVLVRLSSITRAKLSALLEHACASDSAPSIAKSMGAKTAVKTSK